MQIPLPIYSVAPIGGDTQITNNIEYRIPIAGPVDFSFFADFGLDMALNHNQLQLNPQANANLNGALYGCPQLVNGTCQGGVPWSALGVFPSRLGAIPGTNIVPRTFGGTAAYGDAADHQRAGSDLFCLQSKPLARGLNFKYHRSIASMFPAGGAGDFTYDEAQANYGAKYFLWEPSKTLRVTVSTSF